MWQKGQKLKMQGNLLRMRLQDWSKTVPYFEIRRNVLQTQNSHYHMTDWF